MKKMSSRKDRTVLILQFTLLIFQFEGKFCKTDDSVDVAVGSTIFDSHVLNTVKTLFNRNLQSTIAQPGRKKSTITTTENFLHLRVDPREFGNSLLNQANENAARKSDIYMNKAIDATALGVAVLKLIFGRDAKMVMKDGDSKDGRASLRTSPPRPHEKITLWPTFKKDQRMNEIQAKDKIGKLNMNILKLVKNLRHSDRESDETKSEEIASQNKDPSRGSKLENENNLERLLSLMKASKNKEENSEKKSWVLLKVPSKQPQDELGMLNDPVVTEDSSDDAEDLAQTHSIKILAKHQRTGETRRVHNKGSHKKESNKGLMTKIQDQVKHLADIIRIQNKEKQSSPTRKHHLEKKQQSKEGKSFTSSSTMASKSLKTEPFQEVNAVKTDKTEQHISYENSVKNLLEALQKSVHKPSSSIIKQQRRIKLVPLRRKEEQAASKDVVSGVNPSNGAVVSLDALRQLGQLLGLSSQKSDEKNISPYTGTQDTLTLATAMPPEAAAPTTPLPPPTTPKPHVQYTANPQNSLNRISEQLKMFAERGLRGHNDYRKLHHAKPLKWSEDLASAAEKLAYQAAKKGTTRRSELVEKKGYGENVAKIANTVLENAGEEATRHWYNEKQHFTFSDPVIDEGTKAFTQMIWKGTQILGMGAAKDDDTGELYVVALYSPKGNDQGTLRENLKSDGTQHQDVYASIFKKSAPARHE